MYGDLKILTGTSNAPLAQAICEHLGCQLTPALCEKFSDGESRIEIDLGKRGAEIPASLYGVFFEEITGSGDGGLYAEMIRNRGFEEGVLPTG